MGRMRFVPLLLSATWMVAAALAAPAEPEGLSAPVLALESELSPVLNKARVSTRLDALAEGAKKRMAEAPDARARLETLLHYLTQEKGYASEEPGAEPQNLSLTALLQTGRAAPEILAVLYAETAQRHGMTLVPCYAPDRLLLLFENGPEKTFVDLADKAVGLTEAAYRLKLALPPQGGPWLDPLPPTGVEAFLRRRRAEILLAAGQPGKALADMEKAVALDPSRAEHQLALARIRWACADLEGARKALAAARAIRDDDAAALLDAHLLAASGDAEAALAAYGRILNAASEPLRRDAALGRARLRASSLGGNRYDLAASDFRKALELGAGAPAVLGLQAAALGRDLASVARRTSAPSPAGDLKAQLLELIAQARAPSEETRQKAQARMAAMGPRAIPYLKEALGSGTPEVRLGALQLLAVHPDPACVDEVLACLKAPEPQVRLGALSSLGTLAETESLRPRILPAVREVLEQSPTGELARRAATVLARHRDPAAAPYFRKALEDANPENRRQAVLELGKLGDRASLPALRKALADGHPRVRARAAQALAALDDAEAVPALIEALKDEDRDVRQDAESALQRLTRQNLGPDPAKWNAWREEHPSPP